MNDDPEILRFFQFSHLPRYLQDVSQPFTVVASFIVANLPDCEQRQQALQKLLEAKDAAVRCMVKPAVAPTPLKVPSIPPPIDLDELPEPEAAGPVPVEPEGEDASVDLPPPSVGSPDRGAPGEGI